MVSIDATDNDRPRGRGRPPGRSAQGEQTRAALNNVATRLLAEHRYEATTLRRIANEAGVSPGLLYRYFPSKVAVVVHELYARLSTGFAAQADAMPPGSWRTRSVLHT